MQPGCTIELLSIPPGNFRKLQSLRPSHFLQFPSGLRRQMLVALIARALVQLLKFIFQTELQLAIGQTGAGDFSEITIAQVLVRIRELRCVKRVEKLHPKLH